MKSHIRYIFYLLLLLLIGNSSCRDDMFNDMYGSADGYSRIKLSYSFDSFHPTGIGSRSDGDMYDAVRNLWVVVYQQSDDGDFTLYDGYPKLIYNPASSDTSDPSTLPGSSHPNDISQSISLPAGTYQLYAVANIDDFDNKYKDQISTPADLKAIDLEWQQRDTGIPSEDNDQMFGYFSTGTSTTAEGDETDPATINVGTGSLSLHADLVRAASKVTVAYDGSQLAEGISIYIKSVSIKNIPLVCYLGNPNTINETTALTDGETITYSESVSGNSQIPYPVITKDNPYFPRKTQPDETGSAAYPEGEDPHSRTSGNSLFFYENLQGTGPNKSDYSDDNEYKVKDCATYIEVETRYESTNPENPNISNMVYRFALGNDVKNNYDAVRNHHYKLTLCFRGTSDEPDWRIERVTYLNVTQPKVVDYRGLAFYPNNEQYVIGQDWQGNDVFFGNQGHNFNDNYITVTSYQTEVDQEDGKKPLKYKYEFLDMDENPIAQPTWLANNPFDGPEVGAENYETRLKINYNIPSRTVKLNTLLESNTQDESDLSRDKDGKMTTANCYIVKAKGTYTLPLVYGNAVEGGEEITGTYSGFSDSEPTETSPGVLGTFRNYLNDPISSAYILEDTGTSNQTLSASVVWQDSPNLISEVRVEKSLYSNKGGLQFTIGTIAEGNAVLAVKDNDGKIMWSWHIWVTSLELDRKVPVAGDWSDALREYEIMPVNLGWCSNGGQVTYYDKHECKVKFTQILEDGTDGNSMIVDIVQQPHTIFPMGNNTYYQWGRKDPFVGSNASWSSKDWYAEMSTTAQKGYTPLNDNRPYIGDHENPDYVNPNDRKTTSEILGELIQNPDKLNNPRFKDFVAGIPERNPDGTIKRDGDGNIIYQNAIKSVTINGVEYPKMNKGVIDDLTYSNLWSTEVKTIYDPCPVGYQVSPMQTYSGFTPYGNAYASDMWERFCFTVLSTNMPVGYGWGEKGYENGLLGFYTNFHQQIARDVISEDKTISLAFPMTGYLDYDAIEVYYVGEHSYIWSEELYPATYEYPNPNTNAYNFKACIKNAWGLGTAGLLDPRSGFFATDGFSVRPTIRITQY